MLRRSKSRSGVRDVRARDALLKVEGVGAWRLWRGSYGKSESVKVGRSNREADWLDNIQFNVGFDTTSELSHTLHNTVQIISIAQVAVTAQYGSSGMRRCPPDFTHCP